MFPQTMHISRGPPPPLEVGWGDGEAYFSHSGLTFLLGEKPGVANGQVCTGLYRLAFSLAQLTYLAFVFSPFAAHAVSLAVRINSGSL